MAKQKAPKLYSWTLTKQQWALFEEATRQLQAAQQDFNTVVRGLAAAFGADIGTGEIISADAKKRQLVIRVNE